MSDKDVVELHTSERFERSEVGEPVVIQAPLASTGDDNVRAVRVYGRHQVLERYLGFLPMLAFCSTLQCSWETIESGFGAGLYNGGPVALVYGFLVCLAGTTALASSFGEMASILPVAGAQYHWAADLAPFAPQFFSLMQGWMTVLAWIAGVAVAPFFVSTQITGLLVLNYPDYVHQRWHDTLLMWAIVLVPLLSNIWGRRLLAPLEVLGGIFHVVMYPIMLVVIICLGTRNTSDYVWKTKVHDLSGWSNYGVAFSLGLISSVFPLGGFDGVLHMAEEVKNAPRVVPKAMVMAVFVNGVFAWFFLIALLYNMGDINEALNTSYGYPITQVFFEIARGSPTGTNGLMCFQIMTGFLSLFGTMASVSPTFRIPIRALFLTVGFTFIVSFIQIGSTTAFNAVLSLSSLTLYISYMVPIVFLILRKIRAPHTIPFGPWRIWGPPWVGLAVNIFSVIYGVYIIIFLPFPSTRPVTWTNMNYGGIVVGVVMVFALLDYLTFGRKRWLGPARKVAEE
ncbi:MAG: hypothetical protein Q9227_006040 [Pyrenula ochraceoflavens]